MLDYRIWQFVSIFLIVYGVFFVLTQVLRNRLTLLRKLGFLSLYAVSLVFVLSAISHFGGYHPNLYFIELGKFFQIPDNDDPNAPPVKIGDKDHYPDVLLSGFQGLITISYERSAGSGDSPNQLVVTTANLKQPLAVYEVISGDRTFRQVVNPGGEKPVSISITSPAEFSIALESNPEKATTGLSVAFDVQLRVDQGLLVVYRPKPYRIVPLNGLTQQPNEAVRVVRISDDSAPAPDTTRPGSFLATISVEPGRQAGSVRAFLELPTSPAAATEPPKDFVVNNGLTRLGYSFGTEVPVGSRQGALITVDAPSAPVGKWMQVVILLWMLPVLFFLLSSFISRSNSIWILLPLVQLLLAVRFVLGLRAYLLSPYNGEGVETAVLGSLFIPLMIFCGLFSVVIRLVSLGDGQRTPVTISILFKKLVAFLKSFPPFYYWLSTLIILPAIYYRLQISPQRASYLYTSVAAFEWRNVWTPLLILLTAPPIFWALALLAHAWMARKFRKSEGREFANYGTAVDEPITYALENPPLEDKPPRPQRPRTTRILRRVCLGGLVLLCPAVVASVWIDPKQKALSGIISGLIWALSVAGLALFVWVHRRSTASWSKTVNVALEGLLIVTLAAGLLWFLQLLGLRDPEYVLRWMPMRVSAVFQLLGLILTMRLLAVFFFRDWKQLDDPLRGRELWGFLVVFIAPLLFIAIPSVVAGDLGAVLVNWPPLLGMTLVVTGSAVFVKQVKRKWWRWASVALGVSLLAGVLLVYTGTEKFPGLSSLLISDVLVKNLPTNTITHRILLREGQARAERAALASGGEKLIGAMEQFWKMLHYASHGGQLGYKRDGRPATVPIAEGRWDANGNPKDANANFALISLSEAVFSVYVLGEHGLWGGVSLLLLYFLFFAVVCWRALRSFPDAIMRIALLVGIALAIAYPAIYVAAANVNGAIFTGQDMPLLGLRSYTDILHSGLLLALLAAGLAAAGVAGEAVRVGNVGQLIARRNITLLVLLLLVPTLWSFWCLRDVTVANRAKYQESFNLDQLNYKLQRLVEQRRIRIKSGTKNELDHDRWATRSLAGDLVTVYIDRYNRRPQRGDDYDEKQWFKVDMNSGVLSVNRTRYYQPSPFRSKETWQGAITEGNEPARDVLSGAGVRLRLKQASQEDQADYDDVDLSRPQADYRPRRRFRVIDEVRDSNGNPTDRLLFTVYTMLDAKGAVLRPNSDGIYLNGVPLYEPKERKSPSVRLDYGDTIAVAEFGDKVSTGGDLKRPPRYLFTYQLEENASFSYVAWFNGVQQRVYPQRDAFPSALLIAEAVEREATQPNKSLPLTLNARLNREVHKVLEDWKNSLRLPKLTEGTTRRIGVTLMNPDNGDLVALASDSGNRYDPEDDKDARELRDSPSVANVNFTRHIIGSAVKPFTAAATLYSYPSLTRMTILDNRPDKRTIFGQVLADPGETITASDNRTVVHWDEFLPFSDNLYAVSLGLMGLTADDRGGAVRFSDKDAGGLHVQIGDLPVQTRQPLFVRDVFSDDKDKKYNVGDLGSTPLAENYWTLFNVRPDAKANDYDTGVWANAQVLGLLNSDANNNNLFAISPERTNLHLTHVAKTWELRSILLGGGVGGPASYGRLGSEWSNVLLAQALARIVTGKEVKARLVVHDQDSFKDWLSDESGADLWRFEILRGLQGVTRLPKGTAFNAINPCVVHINEKIAGGEKSVGKGGRYFTVFSKTGTLKKDDKPETIPDSIYIFAAGIWDDALRRLENPIVGVVYIEQGGEGKAHWLARDLLRISDRFYEWGKELGQRELYKPCG